MGSVERSLSLLGGRPHRSARSTIYLNTCGSVRSPETCRRETSFSAWLQSHASKASVSVIASAALPSGLRYRRC